MEADTQKIWRYMDLTKFISLIANEALFFSCPSGFDDPFEGHRPRSDMEALSKMLQQPYDGCNDVVNNLKKIHPDKDLNLLDLQLEEYRKTPENGFKIVNERFGVNCWHKNEHESEAMWKLYSNLGQGVAIESTVKQLQKSILDKNNLVIDSVRYRDFDNDPIDKGHLHYGLLQKRMSFKHEEELRAIISLKEEYYGKGMLVKCDLNILINNIHVSPFLKKHIKDDIEKFCYGKLRIVNKPIIYSTLLCKPDYGIDIKNS
jgi:hypothetical protein